MSEILSDTKFYTLESKSTLQAALSTLRSGVVYTLVACVGVIIGVVGTSIVFEKTQIEPKIAEVAKKIEEGVKNIPPATVVEATAAITDLSKSGEHVVEAVMSLAEGGNVEGGTSKETGVESGTSKETGVEMSNMRGKTSLPLSVGDLNATAMSTINQKANEKANGAITAGLGQFNGLQNAATGQFNSLQNTATGQLNNNIQGQINNASQLSNSLASKKTAIQGFQGIGGGRKTQINRKPKSNKLTNEPKVNKKPRTKKCLVTKGNQMYMSFCI